MNLNIFANVLFLRQSVIPLKSKSPPALTLNFILRDNTSIEVSESKRKTFFQKLLKNVMFLEEYKLRHKKKKLNFSTISHNIEPISLHHLKLMNNDISNVG